MQSPPLAASLPSGGAELGGRAGTQPVAGRNPQHASKESRRPRVLPLQKGFDVFNALDLMENKTFLEKLKFGIGDGNLQYYLYNWKCPSMAPEKVGASGRWARRDARHWVNRGTAPLPAQRVSLGKALAASLPGLV